MPTTVEIEPTAREDPLDEDYGEKQSCLCCALHFIGLIFAIVVSVCFYVIILMVLAYVVLLLLWRLL
jgi:hypothetical protein